jgi:ADP-dependent NAD(P)H-hydrate dehydratase / NAD(P)H-hydrate epimerase
MSVRLVDDALLREWVRAPSATDHKYSRGVLGLMIGSLQYPGAALLGTNAALRTGIGMVRFLGPQELSRMVVMAHPEVVVSPGNIDAWVIGSGIRDPAPAGVAEEVASLALGGVPVVLDAGGLAFADRFGPATLLTPHSGELGSVVARAGLRVESSGGESEEDRDVSRAQVLAGHLGQCVLVKGSMTKVVEPGGTIWSLPVATPWLATAGTGDVLAGIIGALVASHATQLMAEPALIAQVGAVGALIHQRAAARAAARAAESTGAESTGAANNAGGPITPSDLCEQIPAVIAQILSA